MARMMRRMARRWAMTCRPSTTRSSTGSGRENPEDIEQTMPELGGAARSEDLADFEE
jgi:hypothetical protein